MQVKKFVVKTIEEGWLKIYKELGENPVILSIKEINGAFEILAAKSVNIDNQILSENKFQDKKLFGRFINFFGGVSSGKTTTLAKVAALLKFERGKKVAVLSLDLFKVGGIDALRNFCNLMQIPCIPVKSLEEFSKLEKSLSTYNHILVDYPSNMLEIPEILDIYTSLKDKENLLILSADKRESVIYSEVEAFSVLGVDSTVLTKVDLVPKEEVLQLVETLPLKVSFICDGYQVPSDLKEPKYLLEKVEVANA